MRACASVHVPVHECAMADILERSYTSLGKGFLLLLHSQNGGARRQNHRYIFLPLCIFLLPEGEAERQRYGLAAATTTESANTKMVGTENSVAHPSIIKRNKTSP